MSDLTPDSLCQQPRLAKRVRTDSNAHVTRSRRGYSADGGEDQDDHDEPSEHDEEQRAQQAFRQRTRDYIADLEERLATQARTSSRKVAKLNSEVQELRRRCQALQRRLHSIGQIASEAGGEDGVSQIRESHERQDVHGDYEILGEQSYDEYGGHGDASNQYNPNFNKRNTNIRSNGRPQSAAADGAGHSDAILGHYTTHTTTHAQQLPTPATTHNFIASPVTTTANSIADSTLNLYHNAHLPTQHATSPSRPSPTAPQSQHSETLQHSHQPTTENSQHPEHQTQAQGRSLSEPSPHATHEKFDHDQTPYALSAILPQHVPPTCPLDRLLLNLLQSRADMVTHGLSTETVLGPAKGVVIGFLDQSLTTTVHPISRIISEILSTFPNIALPEKMGMFYKMHLTIRWQISPTPETYNQMPLWLRPTVTQITVPHAAWIDNIPWPGVRDLLIRHSDRYPFEDFSDYYSQNVTVNWNFDDNDALVHEKGNVVLHSIFEKHVQKLENWTVSSNFQARFPEMSHFICGEDRNV
ncbi:hypothetical protein BKA63DRAFT_154158 [Paraphoma chrysanthemicola]|nr:hypothetical protein BKA63DRAFT_154158 [Paraphoma chrysanthemicola]